MRRYRIEPRPQKDSQHPGNRNYIEECAEVDFLHSEQIEEIVREGIENHLDTEIVARTKAQEARDGAKLRPVSPTGSPTRSLIYGKRNPTRTTSPNGRPVATKSPVNNKRNHKP